MLVPVPHQQTSAAALEKETIMSDILKIALGIVLGTFAVRGVEAGARYAVAKRAERREAKAEASEAPAKAKAK